MGRKTLTYEEAGAKKAGKYIGMFYWTWHTDGVAEWVMPDGSIANTTEIIANNLISGIYCYRLQSGSFLEKIYMSN